MLARAENGRHVVSPLISSVMVRIAPGWSEGRRPGIVSRCSGSMLRIATKRLTHSGMTVSRCRVASRGSNPSSIALICSARYFELIRHCARLPAMNQRPGWPVRVYMLRSSWLSPNPQIGPTRAVTSSPNSLRTRSSWRLVAGRQHDQIGGEASRRSSSARLRRQSRRCRKTAAARSRRSTTRSEQPTLK